jgi:hypothetical protein
MFPNAPGGLGSFDAQSDACSSYSRDSVHGCISVLLRLARSDTCSLHIAARHGSRSKRHVFSSSPRTLAALPTTWGALLLVVCLVLLQVDAMDPAAATGHFLMCSRNHCWYRRDAHPETIVGRPARTIHRGGEAMLRGVEVAEGVLYSYI